MVIMKMLAAAAEEFANGMVSSVEEVAEDVQEVLEPSLEELETAGTEPLLPWHREEEEDVADTPADPYPEASRVARRYLRK